MSQADNRPLLQQLTGRYALVTGISVASLVPLVLLLLGGLPAIHDWFLPHRLAAFWHQPWTLWAPSFVHYTPLHLGTNLCFWWYLGAQVERHGRLRLALLFMITAGISNACQWFVAGPDFGGLSGVVYALLGYTWMWQRRAGRYQVDSFIAIALLALIPITATGAFGKYANIAHLSGLIAGALIAVLESRWLRHNNDPAGTSADSKQGTKSS